MSNNYTRINANGATNVQLQPCTLYAVTINTKGTTANTLTLTDGAGGPTIAVIDTVAPLGPSLFYKVQCKNGLVAVMATGTPADVTISSG